MKFILSIVAFAAAVFIVQAQLTEEQILRLKSYHNDCIKETGVDSEVVTKSRNGVFSEDIKLKEHFFCVAKRIGFMNDAGQIQREVLLSKLSSAIADEAIAQKLIEECAVEKGTPGETAFETVRCYYIKTPKHISIL